MPKKRTPKARRADTRSAVRPTTAVPRGFSRDTKAPESPSPIQPPPSITSPRKGTSGKARCTSIAIDITTPTKPPRSTTRGRRDRRPASATTSSPRSTGNTNAVRPRRRMNHSANHAPAGPIQLWIVA